MDSRDQARKCFEEQGERLVDISERLGINYNTLKQWKSRYKWKQTVTKKKKKKVTKIVTVKSEKNVTEKPIPDKPEESLELTEKQRLFCLYWVDNRNATQAYLKAYGGSYDVANVNGSRLLVNASVKAEINRLREIKKKSLMIGPDDIVEQYMRIAFSNMRDFADFGSEQVTQEDEDGNEEIVDRDYFRFKDSKLVDGGLIVEIKKSRQGMSIKLENRQKALEWLSNFFEMNPQDKHRKEYDCMKLQLEKDRFEHTRKMDEKKDW